MIGGFFFQTDTLNSCAVECLNLDGCRGFSFQMLTPDGMPGVAPCQLALTNSTVLEPDPGAVYFDID